MPERPPRGRGGGRGRADAGGSQLDPERTVYGRHPVREASRGRRRILALHATGSALEDLSDIAAKLRADGCPVTQVEDSGALAAISGTGDHQGVVAEVEAFPYVGLDELLARSRKAGIPPLILCLDQVTDPHNLGAIARVADAAGATGILVPEHRSARVTAAAVKASAGALEHVLVARCTNLANEIERVKGANLWSYAATERGTTDWTDADLADGALLVLGAEGPGIRPRVEAACDVHVRIPMAGSVASLNVATVAAVLAFEAVRQRRAAAR
jgi:23S rRNA (guanosine2251-2'-O)-methyltransferase